MGKEEEESEGKTRGGFRKAIPDSLCVSECETRGGTGARAEKTDDCHVCVHRHLSVAAPIAGERNFLGEFRGLDKRVFVSIKMLQVDSKRLSDEASLNMSFWNGVSMQLWVGFVLVSLSSPTGHVEKSMRKYEGRWMM